MINLVYVIDSLLDIKRSWIIFLLVKISCYYIFISFFFPLNLHTLDNMISDFPIGSIN